MYGHFNILILDLIMV